MAVTIQKAGGTSDVALYLDGRRVGSGRLQVDKFPESNLPLKIGYNNEDFPQRQSGFQGQIGDVRWYGYALPGAMVSELSRRGNDRRRLE